MGAAVAEEVASVGTDANTGNTSSAWGHQVHLDLPAISAEGHKVIARASGRLLQQRVLSLLPNGTPQATKLDTLPAITRREFAGPSERELNWPFAYQF